MNKDEIIKIIKEKAKEISNLIKQLPEDVSLSVLVSYSKFNLQLEEKVKIESSQS